MTNRLLFVLISALLVVPLLTGGLLGARPSDEDDEPYKFLTVFTEVLRLVRTVYVEEPDLDSLMSGAMDGAADALDPFSFFVPAENAAAFGKAEEEGRQQSGLIVLKERGVAFAVTVDMGGAADKAGLERGDILSKIRGRSTRDLAMWEIHEILAGRRSKQVELEVVRQGKPQDLVLELGPAPMAQPQLDEVDGYQVLSVPSFGADTRQRVAELLKVVADRPVLIDLRGNAGGSPENAYQVAGLFSTGKLGELRKRDQTVREFTNLEQTLYNGTPSLLVDRGSQGAAEIFAAVLLQSSDGLLVGESTFGHAGRSQRVTLTSGAFLELTDAFYTGPDLSPLDDGLTPEVVVRLRRFRGEEEEGDEVLQRAIEALQERAAESSLGERKAA